MDDALDRSGMAADENRWISDLLAREQARLSRFIRQRVESHVDAEDILQDVFYEFIDAYRLMKPIEQASAWLFRVARNRIIDRFRSRRITETTRSQRAAADVSADPAWEDLLPSRDAGPDAIYARTVLMEELEAALAELPPEQRDVFVSHEIEGLSFQEISQATGISVNTLLSRKHYAVVRLRRRLQAIYNEFAGE
jgi:RNA polymerase sigma factor (sigma-70 family)